jgi:hypothetical protein
LSNGFTYLYIIRICSSRWGCRIHKILLQYFEKNGE